MTRETSKSIARLAGRFLSSELKTLTRKQQLSLAASALAQAEAEQESVKAWAGIYSDRIDSVYFSKTQAKQVYALVVPVLITRVRPARADKRLTAKRKRK